MRITESQLRKIIREELINERLSGNPAWQAANKLLGRGDIDPVGKSVEDVADELAAALGQEPEGHHVKAVQQWVKMNPGISDKGGVLASRW